MKGSFFLGNRQFEVREKELPAADRLLLNILNTEYAAL